MSLNASEAQRGTDAFFMTIYGIELHKKWKELKKKMNFVLERDFVNWMLDYIISREDVDGSDRCEYVEVMDDDDESIEGTAREQLDEVVDGSLTESFSTSGGKKLQKIIVKVEQDKSQNVHFVKTKPVRRYKCHYCDMPFASYATRLFHSREQHKRELYSCQLCDISFGKLKELVSHRHSEHGNMTIYKCSRCNYHSDRARDIRRHEICVHNFESEFKCHECEKYFYSSSILNKHYKSLHESGQVQVNQDESIYETELTEHVSD